MRPVLFPLVCLLGLAGPALAQAPDTLVSTQVPDFETRNEAALRALHQSKRYGYPLNARVRNVGGTVQVSLVVGSDGRVASLRPLTQLGGGCTDTALALLRRLPWQPSQVAGRPVAVRLSLAVPFPPPGWQSPVNATQAERDEFNTYALQLSAGTHPHEAGVTEPRFPGGVAGGRLDPYFEGTVAPIRGRYAAATGLILLGFVVDADGRVRHPQVLAGVCPPCDSAALAAVRLMPRWTPARRNGRPLARPVQTYVNYQNIAAGFTAGLLLPPPQVPALDSADVLPTYPGGDAALLALTCRTYPCLAGGGLLDEGNGYVTGSLMLPVGGTVLPDGTFTDLRVPRRLAGQYGPQLAAAVAAMPRWQPGRQHGRPVAVHTTLLLPYPSTEATVHAFDAQQKARKAAAAAVRPDTRIYDFTEQMPRLLTKENVSDALRRVLVVPPGVRNGRAMVRFIVTPAGTVRQLELLSATSPELGKAALAAVGRLPHFAPGRQNGQAVSVRYTSPVLVQ